MHEGMFEALEPEDCRALLRTQEVGRVAWTSADAGILVLPVNYAMRGDLVVFRTSRDSVLADLAEGREVAFQVDDVDVETGNGWSVMAQGESATPKPGPELDELEKDGPEPWAIGDRDLLITLRVRQISGRVVDRSETWNTSD
ncbi:Nitroimidazol reductase NimA, pyridoxamine 5'-phosphate oxidase superfamily [Raineyella antarctica]|uniref:Nitroimidazol reductase NimA, pyridoxamine 5'-phosphate oxidase superfamily n=1 Tax=Raineyella antarctica TaxID=1577474 RepID=A0A1G6GQB7_9ACTN|nr:pyridoxamine 5'-phosphate oxidase family protein [Raineyella antarctica]SDB84210.1 Nitroimidazol reductase NimA, pyridoxamine 5'-phosphate oxidase superfamily [Raineyella antarctica]